MVSYDPNKYTITTIECYRPTSDCWYPNYPDDQVLVSMHIWTYKGKGPKHDHCICVWGEDDDGMELWSLDKGIVKKLYRKIIKFDIITKKKLKELGLVRA